MRYLVLTLLFTGCCSVENPPSEDAALSKLEKEWAERKYFYAEGMNTTPYWELEMRRMASGRDIPSDTGMTIEQWCALKGIPVNPTYPELNFVPRRRSNGSR